ncbi:MAG: TonB-dependent receptor [Candidatus Desulfofervidaceae bacterium]|nr:TonB-dependent receptor [Candidatus Desulfofervidaceae bacterium]
MWIQGYYYDWDFKTKEYGSSGYTPRNGDMYYKNIETRYTRPFGTNHLTTVGIEYLQEDLDYNMARKKLHLTSGYIQDETGFAIGIPVDVVLGARLDHHSKYGTEFCPKVSFMLELTEQTKIRGSVGKGFKSPTIRQAYYDEPYAHGSYWYKSNPDLEAETSWG